MRQQVVVQGGGSGAGLAALAACVTGLAMVAVVGIVVTVVLAVVVGLAVAGVVALAVVGGWRYAKYRAERDAAVELWCEDHPDAATMPRRRVVLEYERMRQARWAAQQAPPPALRQRRMATAANLDSGFGRRALGGGS
jgi:hypothetical protein